MWLRRQTYSCWRPGENPTLEAKHANNAPSKLQITHTSHSIRSWEWFQGTPDTSNFCCLEKIIFHFFGCNGRPHLFLSCSVFDHDNETGYSCMEGKVALGGPALLGLGPFSYKFWRNCSLNYSHKEMWFHHRLRFLRKRNRSVSWSLGCTSAGLPLTLGLWEVPCASYSKMHI